VVGGFVVQRQEGRVAQTLAVWVVGTDGRGNRFQQSAKVVEISRLGARLGEIRCLRSAGEIVVLTRRGRKARFRIVWIDEPAGLAGARCIEPKKDLWRLPAPLPPPAKYEPGKAMAIGASGKMLDLDAKGGWVSGLAGQVSKTLLGRSGQQAPVHRAETTASVPPPAAMVERRQRTRHGCTGGAEVRRESIVENGERLWGRVTQLSLGGCFVAAMHPFHAKTKVTLLLGVQNIQVRAKGTVCRAHPGAGMGIMFTEVDDQNQRGLEELISTLAKGGRFSQFAS
jgi:hypothetical protein